MKVRRLAAIVAACALLASAAQAQQQQVQSPLPTTRTLTLPPWEVKVIKAVAGNPRPCPTGRCNCTTPDVEMPDLARGKTGIWTITAEYALVDGVFHEIVSMIGPRPWEGAPELTPEESVALKDAANAALKGARCSTMQGRAIIIEGFGFKYD